MLDIFIIITNCALEHFRKESMESMGLQFCFVLHESFNRDMIDVSEISSRI